MQVRCITVSIPYSFCVNAARSSVWFLVEPPAPHVILIARGFRSARRDIRKSRLLKPWIRLGLQRGSILRYLGSPVPSGVGRTRKCRKALELVQIFRPTSFRIRYPGLTRYGLRVLQIAPRGERLCLISDSELGALAYSKYRTGTRTKDITNSNSNKLSSG